MNKVKSGSEIVLSLFWVCMIIQALVWPCALAWVHSQPSEADKSDPHLKQTNESCPPGLDLGKLYVTKSDKNETLYKVCFDETRASPVYSTHTIDLANKVRALSQHLSFIAKYTLYGTGIDKMYTAKYQHDMFAKECGKDAHIADEEIAKCNYFSRNHLTPHADFTTPEEQALTYYFQNCFPGKQSMNAQNWSKVEDFVRKISEELGKKLRIFTGPYGILKKKNLVGKETELYLDMEKRQVPVALAVWKLVIDEATNQSVAFITSNDIDMNEKEKAKFSSLCESVCDKLKYEFNSDQKAGLTLCCTYKDFANHIKFLPVSDTLAKSGLLMNQKHIDHANSPKTSGWARSRSVSDDGKPKSGWARSRSASVDEKPKSSQRSRSAPPKL